MKERRTQRSNDPLEVAEMYLNAAAQRRDYRALLWQPDGSLVAQANTRLVLELLRVPYAQAEVDHSDSRYSHRTQLKSLGC